MDEIKSHQASYYRCGSSRRCSFLRIVATGLLFKAGGAQKLALATTTCGRVLALLLEWLATSVIMVLGDLSHNGGDILLTESGNGGSSCN